MKADYSQFRMAPIARLPAILCLALLPAAGQSGWSDGMAKVQAVHADPPRSPGSGFVVALRENKAYLVTSSHVVEGDPQPAVIFEAARERTFQAQVRHIESQDPRGLALLVVENPPRAVLSLQRAESTLLQPTDPVMVAGFPVQFGVFLSVPASFLRQAGRDLLLSREFEEGFSGGPVLKDGLVVGIVYGREANFGKFISTEAVDEYLRGLDVAWRVAGESGTRAAGPPNDSTSNLVTQSAPLEKTAVPAPIDWNRSFRARNVARPINQNTWQWSIFIEGPEAALAQVTCVEYKLHPTFSPPVQRVCQRGSGPYPFAFTANGWGTFSIPVQIFLRDGSVVALTHQLQFQQERQ